MEKVRSDFLVLTNAVLLRAPEARPYLLPVDFAETEEALATNLATRETGPQASGGRRMHRRLPCRRRLHRARSARPPPRRRRPWQPFTSQLIRRAKATVVPVFFAGQNSRLFQIASHINLALRLSLIFKEVRDRIGTTSRGDRGSHSLRRTRAIRRSEGARRRIAPAGPTRWRPACAAPARASAPRPPSGAHRRGHEAAPAPPEGPPRTQEPALTRKAKFFRFGRQSREIRLFRFVAPRYLSSPAGTGDSRIPPRRSSSAARAIPTCPRTD